MTSNSLFQFCLFLKCGFLSHHLFPSLLKKHLLPTSVDEGLLVYGGREGIELLVGAGIGERASKTCDKKSKV